ncbi:DUF4178 domain-containing protein [Thermobifida alba]|uniref:DUF4178 domain-containing protein n=1 Tax=Thermobifida alba TaxID=53522 RepID=A0ABY4L1A0_THEAE|nr:DUF4178 domain-containing protein [Thermobifida alba]UPT21451.1 DUF4178 domain-containing protein [Thermobifida alba]HLU98273.1 DUF4178 domain-containing protein [Thermobifida alba]
MREVILLTALALAAVVIYLLVRERRKRAAAPPPAPKPPQDPFADQGTQGDPRTIKVGDMLDFGVERVWVRGTLRLSEGGWEWAEHFVDEGGTGQRRWLSVEEDPDVQLVLWTSRPDLDVVPGPKQLTVEGVTYRLVERGTAAYRSEGTTGLRASGGMDYADYEGPDGRHLAFERFDHGSWEASLGTDVAPGSLTVYPGSN